MTYHSKYHAKKVKTPEGVFDSKKEYARWLVLKDMQAGGEISELQRQVSFEIIPTIKDDSGKVRQRKAVYVADFVYTRDGCQVVEDAKGYKTDVYKLKKKLMLYVHGIEVKEV